MGIGFKPLSVFAGQDDEDEPAVPEEKPKKKYPAKTKAINSQRFDDDYDVIYEAYTNPKKLDKLTQTQKRQMARWKFARQWFSDFSPPTDMEVITALKVEFGISSRQAYTDIINCKKLFASIDKVNDEFDKTMSVERLMRIRNKAMAGGGAKNLDVAAKCELILIKLKGWDRDKAQMPEPVIVNVTINSDPATVGALPVANLDSLTKSWWKKKEDKEKSQIEDVDYEELLNNPRNERDHQR